MAEEQTLSAEIFFRYNANSLTPKPVNKNSSSNTRMTEDDVATERLLSVFGLPKMSGHNMASCETANLVCVCNSSSEKYFLVTVQKLVH